MAAFDLLQHDIQSTIDPQLRSEILHSLWNCNRIADTQNFVQDSAYFDSFFEYYDQQCAAARHDAKSQTLVRTHRDLLNIIGELRDIGRTKSAIKTSLRLRLLLNDSDDSDELLEDGLDLAARIWLMLFVGEYRQIIGPAQRQIVWKENDSILGLLEREFSNHAEVKDNVKLERLFTARNMERIAGLEIIWTSNLADHLRLFDDDTRVAIFHQACFLKYMQPQNIFPGGFIEETLRTLALVLPEGDTKCRQWFESKKNKNNLDPEARKCGNPSSEERQIHKFRYWHDRLIILKQTFDEKEPSTIYQWWHDRRRRVQWYTFWVAVFVVGLTIFFGFIQCIEGGLQVYKTYYPS